MTATPSLDFNMEREEFNRWARDAGLDLEVYRDGMFFKSQTSKCYSAWLARAAIAAAQIAKLEGEPLAPWKPLFPYTETGEE